MKKYKILVVDDEENIRGVLFDILTDEGYSVSLAEDGETALRMIRAEAPDLVLLDIWIPGIDGLQTLKILKKISVNTEVVMMSGHGAIDTAVKATKLGAYDFIEKPFTLETILNKVSGALSEREPQAVQEVKETSPSLSLESWFAGSSDVAVQTRSDIHNGIKSGGPVLVAGPAGCGKEYAARLIHVKRGKGTFVSVECGKLNEDDLDWDRLTSRIGEETANGSSASSLKTTGGTLYFDKLNQLSHKAQRRLAKVLADNAPGGKAGKDIYIIGSVMQPQEKGSRTVLLHKPLLSYFGGVSVRIKSLQERSGDIPELVASLAFDLAEKYDKRIEKVDSALIDAIGHTAFKGNTRELYNFLELAVLACEGVDLTGEYISISGRGSFTPHAPKRAHPVYSKEPAQGNAANGSPKAAKSGASSTANQPVSQRTLKNSVVLCGEGLHSGLKTGIILSPLPPDSGVVFWDISSGKSVPAHIGNVRSTDYSTTLAMGDVTIKTVEHILSALHSYQITNLLIKIGDEAPIMDGSAFDFCEIIETGGIEEQDAMIEPIKIDTTLIVGDPEKGPSLLVEPSDTFSIHYFLDYPQPLGEQESYYAYESGEHYKANIAPARTFGFLKDMKTLEEAGLASGGRLSNVILIDDEKIVNTPLRFDNEPARHKTLDLIGDLYLLGRPIRGHFTARKSGHTHNIAMVHKISKMYLEGNSAQENDGA